MIVMLASWLLTLAFVAVYLRAHQRLVRVARATHELRGPLFAVGLGVHGLRGEPSRLAAIELELARAGRALDDLAAAPWGGRARTNRELVDLTVLVTSFAPTWSAVAAEYGARLRIEPPLTTVADDAGAPAPPGRARAPAGVARAPARLGGATLTATTVLADPLRIAQACANLVGNAAEHGGGIVQVRVRAAGGRVRIEVTDDGPGLPASVAALTASARARHGRRGHGLAIAAAIAEHHGGRLHAASSQGGARLMLDIPAAHHPPAA
jgi:signal transduction histidine kinase